MSQPSRRTCELVDERDGRSCIRCGLSLYAVSGSRHHRATRSRADKAWRHDPSNVVDLCGSGTAGCHGWVHAHPEQAHQEGLYLRAGELPWQTPVLTKRHGWILLDREGGWTPVEEPTRKALT